MSAGKPFANSPSSQRARRILKVIDSRTDRWYRADTSAWLDDRRANLHR